MNTSTNPDQILAYHMVTGNPGDMNILLADYLQMDGNSGGSPVVWMAYDRNDRQESYVCQAVVWYAHCGSNPEKTLDVKNRG
jgi:hypothetical protein